MRRAFNLVRGRHKRKEVREAEKSSYALHCSDVDSRQILPLPKGVPPGSDTFPEPPPPFPPTNNAYQYALSKYSQTVPTMTGNDDGKSISITMSSGALDMKESSDAERRQRARVSGTQSCQQGSTAEGDSHYEVVADVACHVSNYCHEGSISEASGMSRVEMQSSEIGRTEGSTNNVKSDAKHDTGQTSGREADNKVKIYTNVSPINQQKLSSLTAVPMLSQLSATQAQNSLRNRFSHSGLSPSSLSSRFLHTSTSVESTDRFADDCRYCEDGMPQHPSAIEPAMPDATYIETYGDAYVGGPMRYIYPSGYQSLRPRSGPWKLSLLIFAIFMWLSVFIVGYCADMVDLTAYDISSEAENDDANNANNNNAVDFYDLINDDAVIMETRWCGSRVLYSMWVVSISITGLAAAYCSIIGYIQIRDFVVANNRSQPPGMTGKSDYYVKIDDFQGRPPQPGGSGSGSSSSYQTGSFRNDRSSIYQADGTPQFWGGHITRPTQAAVAVTSR